jgi:cobyrinic acid a,c-diamide synthase
VLVIDTEGMTRGIAPLLLGYQQFDREIIFAGVILNKVGGERHAAKLKTAVTQYTDIPLLGALPQHRRLQLAERHLGLIPSNEQQDAEKHCDDIADYVADHVDISALLARAAPLPFRIIEKDPPSAPNIRLGIVRDAAFGFYYPDDLTALERAGAELLFIDALQDVALPPLDGLFIGGGFPETQAARLAANSAFKHSLHQAIINGLPVYAECGGLMYLTRQIAWQGQIFPMVGAIPADTVVEDRPVGRGYVRLTETEKHPWPIHAMPNLPGEIHAHEFHYSRLVNRDPKLPFAYRVLRGYGIDGEYDGIVHHQILASYAHQRHTAANPWTQRFITFLRSRRELAQ